MRKTRRNTMTEEPRPRVGIGLFIVKDGKVLLGKRKNAHGEGNWGGPGGHLEFGESFEECAKREALEEAGIEIENVRFLCLSNFKDHMRDHYAHYVDIGLTAEWKSGVVQNLEPDKKECWEWFDLNDMPDLLFTVGANYIEAYKTGKKYFDA
jgi:8-oxo-dGTP diphosphatase